MKKNKFIKIIALVFAASMFLACSPFGVSGNPQTQRVYNTADNRAVETLTTETMTDSVKLFLGINSVTPSGNLGSRAPFSASEKAAADFLLEYGNSFLAEDGAKIFNSELQNFSFDGKNSQNVVITKPSKQENAKQVILTSSYDNAFSLSSDASLSKDIPGSQSYGAMENATGVAVVMSLMDYYSSVDMPFDLVFLFTGASTFNSVGSYRYVNSMTTTQKNNTLLMLNYRRFGGDNVYLYTDEVKTEHNKFIIDKSSALGTPLKAVPKTIATLPAQYMDTLPYTNWPMIGEHAHFMAKGINVASMFSGNLNSINLSDIETTKSSNLGSTEKDTFSNLAIVRPDYAKQMEQAAKITIETLSDENFEKVMISSKANKPNYAWATNELVASFILLGVMVLLGVLLILLVVHFDKKYPYKPIVKNLKVAVFGIDYETKNDDDIFIDLKKNEPPKPNDPFDGY